MPVHSACQIINESDNKIWRFLEKYVDKVLEKEATPIAFANTKGPVLCSGL